MLQDFGENGWVTSLRGKKRGIEGFGCRGNIEYFRIKEIR